MADVVAEHDRVLLVAHRVIVQSEQIGEPVTERTHGHTSTEMRQALDAWLDVGRSCDPPHVLRGSESHPAGMCPQGELYGQWTVARRRLAARSSANRPSCQGVR
jgi:hypothetical protein